MDVETAEILKGLAADFERLMDLENMDWMIFTYGVELPWFFIDGSEISKAGRWHSDGWTKEASAEREIACDKYDAGVVALRGRFLSTIEALQKAADGL